MGVIGNDMRIKQELLMGKYISEVLKAKFEHIMFRLNLDAAV